MRSDEGVTAAQWSQDAIPLSRASRHCGVLKKLGQVPVRSQSCPNVVRWASPVRWDRLERFGTRWDILRTERTE